MCLYPRLIKNRKYEANKKNGGNVPPVLDNRTKLVPIGCGNCIECRKRKTREWNIRLQEDIRINKNGKFITLTFSNESIQKLVPLCGNLTGYALDNAIAITAVHLFRERWRKKFGTSIRHWLITELGHNGTENIHLHGIIWTNETRSTVQDVWGYGYMWPRYDSQWKTNYVNEQTINYITKYIHKIDVDHKYYKSKVLTSPGIGGNYINRPDHLRNKFNGENTIETYKTRTGHEIALPIYWRNKIYDEEERELLWLNKLDKDERWVMGERVSNENPDEYNNLVKWHRERSTRLGYGSEMKDYNQLQYEDNRRKIMYETRMKKQQNQKKCTNGTTTN